MDALAYKPNRIDEQWERLEMQDDLETQFSELVDGSMRTSFDLEFDGHDLYGRDGRSMMEVAEKALVEAKRIVRINPELWFEVRRRSIEREEIKLAVQMAKGKLPGVNTIVVESDFPAELMDATEDVGGYNVCRKQTMQRILALLPNGKVRVTSQTLDGSNRMALEAVYNELGETPEEGELLGQRMYRNLSPERQAYLNEYLAGIYDRSMTAQYGGEWYAGRRPADYRNTYEFVRQQQDLVQTCIDMKLDGTLTDGVMYDMAATMQARFKKGHVGQGAFNALLRQEVMNPSALQLEVALAGQEARRNGQSFSACGATLRAEGVDGSTEAQLGQAGYGNKKDSDADCEYVSKSCPMCGTKNVKTIDKKISGSKRRISGSCGCSKDYVKS